MKTKRLRYILIALIAAIAVAGTSYAFTLARPKEVALGASGTIQATTVNVSPELPGKVQEVLVDEGQSVKKGDVLFRLDDTLLTAQREAAAAGLAAAQTAAQTAGAAYASAQAQYTLAETQARGQSRSTRLMDWSGKTPDYFNQPKWYFTQEEQLTAAQTEVAAAQAGIAQAEDQLAGAASDVKNSDFVAAEQRLQNARIAYLVALQVQAEGQAVGSGLSPDELDLRRLDVQIPCFDTPKGQVCAPGYRVRTRIVHRLPNQVELSDATQSAYDAASAELTAAQAAYDDLLDTAQAQDMLEARAALAVAKERYQVSQERLSALQTGEQSPQVAAAAAGLEQAKNAAQQAQDAVGQAQAGMALLDAQLSKLEVKAPLDGVVLTRNIEPGEYVAPGASALVMGQLSTLTITVYVPEDRYGEIHLGQQAAVSVDSFPEDNFEAKVSYISDQAEFTPRNVQTVEGRSSTVYAIKLSVSDPEGRLKPGMPADVIFGN